MKKEVIVIALGGNALVDKKAGKDIRAQHKVINKAIQNISFLFNKFSVAIVHGNGFQIGELLLQNEIARGRVPVSSLDILDAETQGELGYLIEQSIINELQSHKINKSVVTFLTQVLVSKSDKEFKNPSKPIGAFYKLKEDGKLEPISKIPISSAHTNTSATPTFTSISFSKSKPNFFAQFTTISLPEL